MDRSSTSNSNEDPHDHQPGKLWKVVSYLRKDFKPNRNAIGDTEGRMVPLKNRAEAITTYFESKHWMSDNRRSDASAARRMASLRRWWSKMLLSSLRLQ